MDYADALVYLDSHIDMEKMLAGRVDPPTLDRMRRLSHVLGDPQHDYPVIHITGTNGKGTTAQIVTKLLMAHGLSVGTFSSPHLERVNERIARNGEPIDDVELGEVIGSIADLELLAGVRPSYFEILTSAAYRWFAETPVDVAVVEVGMLGRWDATNVADGRVAVVTNVALDHTEYAGPTMAHIAREKAGVVKPGSALVLGVTDPELAGIFRAEGPGETWQRDEEYACTDNQLALGGRLLALQTPFGTHHDVFLPLHGRHQGDNAATALAASELFFGAPTPSEVLDEAFASVTMPGRFEVLGHQPLVIVDGAHNLAGADVCASVMAEDFDPAGRKLLVAGFLRGRDPAEMLGALRADEYDVVILCTPPSARGIPAVESAKAARWIGCEQVVAVDDVAGACDAALRRADADDAMLVTGSLYVVGAARPHLIRTLP